MREARKEASLCFKFARLEAASMADDEEAAGIALTLLPLPLLLHFFSPRPANLRGFALAAYEENKKGDFDDNAC